MKPKFRVISETENMYNGGFHMRSIIETERGKCYQIDTALITEGELSSNPIKYYETMSFQSDYTGRMVSMETISEDRTYIRPGTELDDKVKADIQAMHKYSIGRTVWEEEAKLDDYDMSLKEKQRKTNSTQKINELRTIREHLTRNQATNLMNMHTKEFIDFLERLDKTHPNEPQYRIANTINELTAVNLLKEKMSQDVNALFKINPKYLYNTDLFDVVKSVIDNQAGNTEFMSKLKDLPLTMRQVDELYNIALQSLRMQGQLATTDIIPDMRDIAERYARIYDITLKTVDEPQKQYISFGMTDLPNDYRGVQNTPTIKPRGGIYACEYRPNDVGNHSDWEAFCRREDFRLETLKEGMVFSIAPNAKVLTIDTIDDIEKLLANYPHTVSSRGMTLKSIDFEKIATKYDVVDVTPQGQFAFDSVYRMKMGKLFEMTTSAAWDVPTIIVLNLDVIQNIEPYIANEADLNVQMSRSEWDGYDEETIGE